MVLRLMLPVWLETKVPVGKIMEPDDSGGAVMETEPVTSSDDVGTGTGLDGMILEEVLVNGQNVVYWVVMSS